MSKEPIEKYEMSEIPEIKEDENEKKPVIPEHEMSIISTKKAKPELLEDYLGRFDNGNLIHSKGISPEVLEENKISKRKCREIINRMHLNRNQTYLYFERSKGMIEELEKVNSQPQDSTLEIKNFDDIDSIFADLEGREIDEDKILIPNETVKELQQLTDEELLIRGIGCNIPIEHVFSNKDILIMDPPENLKLLDQTNFKEITIKITFTDGIFEITGRQYVMNVPKYGYKYKKDEKGFYLISTEDLKKPEEQQVKYRGSHNRALEPNIINEKAVKFNGENVTVNIREEREEKRKNYKVEHFINNSFNEGKDVVKPLLRKWNNGSLEFFFNTYTTTKWTVYNSITKSKLEEFDEEGGLDAKLVEILEKEQKEENTIKEIKQIYDEDKKELVEKYKETIPELTIENIKEALENQIISEEGKLEEYEVLEQNLEEHFRELEQIKEDKENLQKYKEGEKKWNKEMYTLETRKTHFTLIITYDSFMNELNITIKPETIEQYKIIKMIFEQQIQNVIISYELTEQEEQIKEIRKRKEDQFNSLNKKREIPMEEEK